jgi:hypothetical protein
MKELIIASMAMILIAQSASGQHDSSIEIPQEKVKILSESITAEDLKEHVRVLASDEFEGRETGTEGNLKAAEYIADKFKSFGLPAIGDNDTYFQEVAFTRISWKEVNLSINGESYRHMRDFMALPDLFPGEAFDLNTTSLVFAGYGIDDPAYSDYKGKNLKGKTILIYKGEPRDENGNSLITGDKTLSIWSIGIEEKLLIAKKHGVKAVFIIEDKLRDKIGRQIRFMLGGKTIMGKPASIGAEYTPYFEISTTLAEDLMGKKYRKVIKARKKIEKKGTARSVSIPVNIVSSVEKNVKTTPGQNVLGYIEGSDPAMKEEVVIISAHYDHLGKRGEDIYNGADDNGSGTGSVLEIAQALAMAKEKGMGPKRSILCLLVTGEEKGLLGSEYYVSNPIFPLAKTVADVNIDMIGRMDNNHTDSNYVYVIGSDRLSTELHEINEIANATYTGLQLDYTFNEDDDPNRFYYRSDHYNFAKHGIPSIFYFSGVHEDYHRPGDTMDKIMYGKTATIARLAFHTAWELANRKKRIQVNVIGRS